MSERDYERSRRRPPQGRPNYVPSTRVGRDEPRRTSIGSQSRGGSRPVGRQGRDSRYRSDQNYRTLSGRDTGYSLKGRKQRPLNFERRHGGPLERYGISNRMLVVLAAAVVLVLIVILAISSCIRGANDQSQQEESATSTNQWDSRVAGGVSEDLTGKFTSQLNQDEKLASIAQKADRYADTRLPELALSEPEAIDFVAAYPDADHSASDYGEGNEKGSYPLLYDWDSRWGNADYAGTALAITGSGPTTFAMAYYGLTGKTDKTPATFAADATEKNYTTTDTIGTTADFFSYEADQSGISCKQYSSPSASTLTTILETKGTVVVVQLKAGLGGTSTGAHWALVVNQNEDGSVTLYDPASSVNSSHTWSAGTIAKASNSFFALSGGSSSEESDSKSSSDSSESSSSSDSGSSSSSESSSD